MTTKHTPGPSPWEPIPAFVADAIRTLAGVHPFRAFLLAYGGDKDRALVEYRHSAVARSEVRSRRAARRAVRQAQQVASAEGWEWSSIVASVIGGAS